jgi:hypothetical protein
MQLVTKSRKALFFVILVLLPTGLLPFQDALAKPSKRIHGKLQPLTPIFDTSLVPKPARFELKVSKREFFKDPSTLLHGSTKVVDLKASERADVLRGRVEEERRESIINTREYGVKPRFFIDLQKLEARYAPDIARLMEAEIEEANRKLAGEVERAEKLMNQRLRPGKPIPDILPSGAATGSIPDAARKLEGRLAQSKLHVQDGMPDASRRLEKALSASRVSPEKIPSRPSNQTILPPQPAIQFTLPPAANVQAVIPAIGGGTGNLKIPASGGGTGNLKIPSVAAPDTTASERLLAEKLNTPKLQIPAIPPDRIARIPDHPGMPQSIPSAPGADTSGPAQKLAEELVKAKLQVPPDLQVDAKLKRAKERAQDALKQAEPAMNNILTQLRAIPARLPEPGKSTEAAVKSVQADLSTTIQWDAWHARFAELARDPILKAVDKVGNPAGANTVEITVWSNHHLAVRLSQPGTNKEFDLAILQAYQSLDGNAALVYPDGSRRSSISFLVDNKHTGKGAPAGLKSQTSIGDKEILRFHR